MQLTWCRQSGENKWKGAKKQCCAFLHVCCVFCHFSPPARPTHNFVIWFCSFNCLTDFTPILTISKASVVQSVSLLPWLTVLCVRPMKQSSTERQISHLLLPDVDSQMQIHFFAAVVNLQSWTRSSGHCCKYSLVKKKQKKEEPPMLHTGVILITALLLFC